MGKRHCRHGNRGEGAGRRRGVHASTVSLLRHTAILIIGGAGALRGHHQRAERPFRRALGAEHLALPGFDGAFQHFAALARFWIRDANVRNREFAFGVEGGIGVAKADARMVDRPEAAPLKERAQLVDPQHRIQRRTVAGVGNDAGVLVFDFAAAVRDLPQHHPDRLQHVERLEAGNDQRAAVMLGYKAVGFDAGHHRDVTGSEKAVDMQPRTVEDRLDRRHDRDVIAEHREIADALALGLQHGQRRRRHCRLKPDAEKNDFAMRVRARQRQRVHRRIDHAYVGAVRLGLQQRLLRSGNAHRVAEGREDDFAALARWPRRRRSGPSAARIRDSRARAPIRCPWAACPRSRSGRSNGYGRRRPP